MQNRDIKKALKEVRPKLSEVSARSYSDMWGFAVFNIVLGWALFKLPYPTTNPTLVIINDVFTYDLWGAVFIALGIVKIYVLLRNNWAGMRLVLIVAVLFKMIWLIAILIQIIMGEGSIAILFIWGMLSFLQANLYIHFVPSTHKEFLNGYRAR